MSTGPKIAISDPELRALAEKTVSEVPGHLIGGLRSIVLASRPASMPKDAPGHSMYSPEKRQIVLFKEGVYDGKQLEKEQIRRSVLHEIAHHILEADASTLPRWTKDTNGEKYVDEYAKTSPDEDFADTFSEFFIHSKETRSLAPRKFQFIDELAQPPREKTAMVNLISFTDEIVKLASTKSQIAKRLLGKAVKSRGVQAGALAVGGATAGGAVGHEMGEDEGFEEGLGKGRKNVRQVAVRARDIGRREGAVMYHRALQQSMRKRDQK